jgi:GR25 family glycosyltransferase involved in LPS biosynthesis/tetratricopeptide (TPR) repeat protein
MIVKDESHIIEKTFDNLLSHIVFDYWVICDTGSTDGTQELIKKYFAKKGIPGELVQHAWRDFGYNRTEALKAAFKKSDYILIFDADDSIHGEFKLPPKLTHDFYKLQFGKGFTYYRPLLITAHKPTSFIGVLHEFLKLNDGNPTEVNISGNYYVESGRLGNRSKAGDKYLKDALILKAAYEKEVATGGDLANRYAFYCAQSFKDCGKHDESIEWYTLVADKLNSWVQERYYSCVTLGHLYKGKQNTEKALEYYLKSEKFDPERKEGIIYACELLKDKGLFSLVTLLYEKNRDYERNPRDKLFMHRDIYDDILEFNAAISYCMMDKTKEGYNLFKEVLLRQIAPVGAIGVSYKNLRVLESFLLSDKNTIEVFYKLNEFIQSSHEPREFTSLWNKLFEKHRSNLTNIPKSFKIPKRPCEILLTMTSCKRYDLFHQTVNSLLNHWTDKHKIDKWICVDDNSSKDDRKLMKSTYPFIEFYPKTPAEKGHRESMNIIWNMLKEHKPKYWIHIEDDFLFHTKRSYIEDSIKLIEKNSDIHQVLFNRGYAETMDQVDLRGYTPLEPGFVVHEYKQGQFSYPNCHYWPHYSFRPGVIRADTILKLGNYDSPNTFFEMDYAHRWTNAGYKTAFFDSINCRHIGRLTSERNSNEKKNAYDLNGEGQFNKMNVIKVVNLKRRPDRKEQVTKVLNDAGIKEFDIIDAVDGKEVKPTVELAKLFAGNDFGSRVGVVGCALSHLNLWKALLADTKTNYYVILEDDITLSEHFKPKFEALKPVFEKEQYVLLGYHMFSKNRDMLKLPEEEVMQVKNLNYSLYVGGTFGYSINKQGAKILVDYIAQNGIKHGIDYVVKICSALKCKEVSPSLIYSDWYETPGQNVDTDIQKDNQGINFSLASTLADNFDFIAGKDHHGDDLYFSRMSLDEMMQKALEDSNCQGFNTLGFFKTRADNFTTSQYFGPTDGMYVKKTVEMPTYTPKQPTKVKLLCNWASSKDVSKEFSCMNIPEIKTVDKDPDYFVIINSPPPGEVYDPSRTIVFQMEPWVYDPSKNWGVKTWGEWAEPDPAKFMHVHSHKKFLNNVQWTLGGDLNKLPEKQDRVSFIVSQKLNDTGHVLRHQYVSKFPEMIDVFGRANYRSLSNYIGQVPGDDRYNVYSDYKYALAVENNSEHNYATEKIWEPLLCECLVFYWGCPNLEDYIDSRAFVRLPLENPAEAFEIVRKAVKEDWWSQRIDVIRKMKNKIRTQLGMFPMLKKITASKNTKAFIVTMKTSESRVPIVKKLVSNAVEFGMDHEVFYGVNGKEITVSGNEITYEGQTMKYDPTVRLNKQRMAIGEFGCSWSQIKLYQKLLADSKYDNYLILEDDAELVGDISVLHNLPSSFDIIKLCSSDWFPYVKTSAVNKNFFNIEKRFTNRNTGYIISKAGAKKLLDITDGHVNVPADDLISNAFIRHQIQVIVSETPVFDFHKDTVSTTNFTVY